jgi:hypothetical protein
MTDFDTVHTRLREILIRQRGDLVVTKDGPAGVALEIPGLEGRTIDETLLAELEALTAMSIAAFRRIAEERAAARA